MTTAVARTNAPATLILEGDPAAQLDYAQKAASALMKRVEAKQKKIIINGKQYLEYGDWQTLSRFFGATAATEWTRPIEHGGKMVGYEARAIVYQHGNIISAAEGMCLRSEKRWNGRDWFALRSMAQTRACSKALRNAFGWVAELAGYSATPAEEMTEARDNPHVNRPEDIVDLPALDDPDRIPPPSRDVMIEELPKMQQRPIADKLGKELAGFTNLENLERWKDLPETAARLWALRHEWREVFQGKVKERLMELRSAQKMAEPDADPLDTLADAYSECKDAAAMWGVDQKLYVPFLQTASPDDRERAGDIRKEHLERIEATQ